MNILIALIVLHTTATVVDMRSHRIPNALIAGGLLAAAINIVLTGGGLSALGLSVLGFLLGIIFFLPLYALGKMGAGDVKLLGMSGAWLGPINVLWAGAFSLIAGGLLALAWLAVTYGPRYLFHHAVGSWAVGSGAVGQADDALTHVDKDSPLKARMPYALAVGVGSVAALYHSGVAL